MTEVKAMSASLDEVENAPLTEDEKAYRQQVNKALIEAKGTQMTEEQKNRLDLLAKQKAALDEKEKKYEEAVKQQQASDAKIPFKFIFDYSTTQSSDSKAPRGRVEVVTNRMLVTHPDYGLDIIRTLIDTYRNKPVPTAAEIKEYEQLLAQRKPGDKVDAYFDRLETKVTDYTRMFEFVIPRDHYSNYGPHDVQNYINWATYHLTSKNDEITDTSEELKNDIIEAHLSDPDLRFMEGLSDMKKDFVAQFTDIIGELRPMALFIKYAGNKVLLDHKDEDGEVVKGLINYICDYVLDTDAMGNTIEEKFKIFGFDPEFYLKPEEEKAMKEWVKVHGEPKDWQLFGLMETKDIRETKGLDEKQIEQQIQKRMMELKTLIGDPSRGIYGLASYWKRLHPDMTPSAQTLVDNLRAARKKAILTNEEGVQIYSAKDKQAGYVYLSIQDAMVSGLLKRTLPEEVLDDTTDWQLNGLTENDIKEKFATTPIEGTEVPLEVSYPILLIIADYMKHFHGDDSKVSLTGQWENAFLTKVRTSGQLIKLIQAAEYLEMPRLANLFKNVRT